MDHKEMVGESAADLEGGTSRGHARHSILKDMLEVQPVFTQQGRHEGCSQQAASLLAL